MKLTNFFGIRGIPEVGIRELLLDNFCLKEDFQSSFHWELHFRQVSFSSTREFPINGIQGLPLIWMRDLDSHGVLLQLFEVKPKQRQNFRETWTRKDWTHLNKVIIPAPTRVDNT